MFRWYVSGCLMEYILTLDVVCATKDEALAAWAAAYPKQDPASWHATATNIDQTTGHQRELLEDLWIGHGHKYESGGYQYGC